MFPTKFLKSLPKKSVGREFPYQKFKASANPAHTPANENSPSKLQVETFKDDKITKTRKMTCNDMILA